MEDYWGGPSDYPPENRFRSTNGTGQGPPNSGGAVLFGDRVILWRQRRCHSNDPRLKAANLRCRAGQSSRCGWRPDFQRGANPTPLTASSAVTWSAVSVRRTYLSQRNKKRHCQIWRRFGSGETGTMKIGGTCRACRKPILGQAITAMGHDWHPDHFICRGCSRSITDEQFYVVLDNPYHSHCYIQSVANRCTYCQAPLLGGYLVDHFGAAFCPIHAQQYPACTFCGRLVPTTDRAAAVCSVCRRTVVASREEAKRPVETVRSWLANRGIVLQKQTVSLELCDHSKLTSLSNAWVGSKCLGVTRTTLWNPFV